MNKIAVIGTGYVGLVTGCCFAESGNKVTCVDIDHEKVENLRLGISPIYESGLDDLLQRNIRAKRIQFTTDLREALKDAWCVFLCLPTPSNEDGSADLHYVLEACDDISEILKEMGIDAEHFLIVNKSTVPVGTHLKVQEVFASHGLTKVLVASNPEFLREGFAIEDFMKPERVVIGTTHPWAIERLTKLYEPFTRSGNPIICMDEFSSEMTKYAANAFLAVKISYMNELSQLCERVGADIDQIRKGIGTDSRIGKRFIFPGIGYGGSCFMPNEVIKLAVGGGSRNTTIKNLWDSSDIQSVDDVPGVQMKDLSELEIYVHGFDFTTMTKAPQKVLSLTRREYTGDKITYKTSSGHTQVVTSDHPIIVCASDTTLTILAEDLKVGDCVYVTQDLKNYPTKEDNFNIDDVVMVKRAPCDEKVVYSLETANQTVITGNGMVSHNCFPKDVRSILSTSQEKNVDLKIIQSAMDANKNQIVSFIRKIHHELSHLDNPNPKVGVWGLAFKPNTDDIREAPALDVIENLTSHGISVVAYDPEAKEPAFTHPENFQRAKTAFEAAEGADLLVICTEWTEFRNLDFSELKRILRNPLIVDGRNLWDPDDMMEMGFDYISIGRKEVRQ